MKGIILAGGKGTRLAPLTHITNKHLIPVYNKQMILYPLETLTKAGITDILLITGPEYAGDFMKLLGSGKTHGCNLTYRIQDEAGGISHALSLAEGFVGSESCCVVLGDNIILDDFSNIITQFSGDGAHIFIKEVADAHRYGVVEIDENGMAVSIEEKPQNPKSSYVQMGLYMYDKTVFDRIRKLTPSARGELEVSELNQGYIDDKLLTTSIAKGHWLDAGTIESLLESALVIKDMCE